MSNFLTCNKWPLRRIIGAVLAPIVIFLQVSQWSEVSRAGSPGRTTGTLIGFVLWWYILYLLLRAPDEPRKWFGVPRWVFGVVFFAVLVGLVGLSGGNGL